MISKTGHRKLTLKCGCFHRLYAVYSLNHPTTESPFRRNHVIQIHDLMHLRTVLEGRFLESPCVLLMGVQHFCSVGIGGGEVGDGGEKVIPLSACPNKTGDVYERGLDKSIK